MQVNNQTIRQQAKVSEAPLELKQGEVVKATIKETLSDTDAILQIRGKEVRARFTEGVPASGTPVTIQVNGQADGMLQAKTIATENIKTPSTEEKILASAGLTGKESPGVKQAVRILLDKGLPVSKETVQELDSFIEKAQGTLEDKIDTVRALANKRLEATGTQLRAVQEALHGRPLNEVLSDIAREIDPEFKLEKKVSLGEKQQTAQTKSAQTAPQKPSTPFLQDASIKEDKAAVSQPTIQADSKATKVTVQNDSAIKEVTEKSTAANSDEVKSVDDKQSTAVKHASELSKTIRKNLELVQTEPDLKQAVARIREEIVNNPKLDRELAQKIDKAAQEAVNLQAIGKERLVEALKTAEVQLTKNQHTATQRNVAAQVPVETTSQDSKLSTLVKHINQEVSKSPNVRQSIEKVKEQIVNNERFPAELKDKVSRALTNAASLEKQGRMTTGKELLNKVLTEVEVSVVQVERKAELQTKVAAQSQQDQSNEDQRPSVTVKEVKAEVQKALNLQQAVETVRDEVISNPKINREVAQKVDQAVKEAVQLQQIGRESTGRERLQQALDKAEVELQKIEASQPKQPTQTADKTESRLSEMVKELKTEIQKEPNLQRSVEKVQEQVIANPKVDREIAQKIEQAVKVSIQLAQIGREAIGKGHLQTALAQAEKELQQLEASQPDQTNQDSQLKPKTTLSNKQDQTTEATQIKETIKNIREQIQAEPNIRNAVQKVQELQSNNKNINPEISRNIERLAGQAEQLNQAGRDRLIKMLQQVETALQQNAESKGQLTSSNTAQAQQQDINLTQQAKEANNQATALKTEAQIMSSQSIKQALTKLQKEPNLEVALDQVRKEISSNPSIDLKTIDKVEKAIEHSQQLNDKGREIAARQTITKELTEIEKELVKTEPKTTQETKPKETIPYDINEQLQSLNIQGKDILITKVTQKLAQATHDFRELKREISRNLENVERVINSFKKNAYPQAKQMLETTISKLDNAILKSEMMLFTDMRTEKQLLQASTQLAEAKKLLAKGDHAQAGEIVHNVKTLIDKIIFKPSEQKIVHFVDKEVLGLEKQSPSQQLLSKFSESTYSANQNHERSARQMYDMVRSLGLNHESDVANSLVFQRNDQSGQEQQHQNLKEVLMKLAQGDGGQDTNPKITQQAEQALTNLTGQQLLSKSDGNGTLQSMFFNLPLMLGGKPENLQVFINSKNEGEQVEWENCNLYFLLETKKIGDVGILLNSTDRNLSITVKNDMPGFKEKMEPVAELTKIKLQEVGYNVSSINFTRMNPVTSQATSHKELGSEIEQAKATRQIFNEKGMDFTI
ncbi:hypothetical protein [Niallia oryzisoli]|uniref:hypothetical protein n=1 Tax=Niallia oryzisoli TaxID=1737571 RepID=UPI003734CE49